MDKKEKVDLDDFLKLKEAINDGLSSGTSSLTIKEIMARVDNGQL